MILFGGLAATAQQTGQMEQQLQQLKQQYQETTHTLEQRIAALEQQIGKQKEDNAKTKQRTVSAVELGAEDAIQEAVLGASSQVGAKFQGQLPSEPTYDLLREADAKIAKLNQQLSTFEFHGYFRSGCGLNSVGGRMRAGPIRRWHKSRSIAPSLEVIVKEFLAKVDKSVDRACFAVAGRVIGGRVKTTNLPWMIEDTSLARELNLNLKSVFLINDLEAIAPRGPDLKAQRRDHNQQRRGSPPRVPRT